MIYPTRLAVLLAAAVAPAALLVGLFFPAYWTAGLALLALLAALAVADLFATAGLGHVEAACEAPGAAGVGESFAVVLAARFAGPTPAAAELALEASGPASAPFGWRARAERDGAEARAAIAFRVGGKASNITMSSTSSNSPPVNHKNALNNVRRILPAKAEYF